MFKRHAHTHTHSQAHKFICNKNFPYKLVENSGVQNGTQLYTVAKLTVPQQKMLKREQNGRKNEIIRNDECVDMANVPET